MQAINTLPNKYVISLSKERLSWFSHSEEDALGLYVTNMRLSGAFHIALHGLEITLRNTINRVLTEDYGDAWHKHPRLLFIREQEDIALAIRRIKRTGKAATASHITSALTFGFWIHILEQSYEELWRKSLWKAFPHSPEKFSRKLAHRQLRALYYLRNHIAHHEPILKLPLTELHAQCIEAIGWVCPDTAAWFSDLSDVPELLERLPHG